MPPRTRKQHQAPPSSQALPRPMATRSSRSQQSQRKSQPVSMPPPPGLGGMEMPPPPSHTEGEKAQEELKRNIVEYRAFLESCDFIEANTQWRKVQDRLEDDERCSRLDKTDRLEIFQEYIHDLEKEEEEQKFRKEQLRQKERKNRDEFRRLMADHKATGLLTAKTHWLDYCAKVKDHPAYLAVASNTSGPPPKDLFEDVAEEMKKQYQEDKANIKDALKAGKFTVTSAWTLDKFKTFIGGVYDLAAVSKTNLKLVFEEVLEQAKEKEEKEAKKRQMLADNFMNLLHSVKEIVASSKWEDCVPLLKNAEVYRAISDESFRREIFDEYVKHLQERVKEKERKQDEEKLVFEEVIERTRKKEEKEAKKRKRLADDFMDFLYSEKEIVASSKWKDCIPLLEDAQEYRAISDESFRQQIFDEYIAHLQEKVEQKKCKRDDKKVHFEVVAFRGTYPARVLALSALLTAEERTTVIRCGLWSLMGLPEIGVNRGLLTALAERWHSEHNTFHLPTGEITVTPEDVWRILRVPLVGDEVRFEATSAVAIGAARRYFQDDTIMCRYLSWDYMVDHYDRLSVYLAGLVGGILMPDRGQHGFMVGWVDMIEQMVRHRRRYAWGSCILAHIYRELHEIVYSGSRSMTVGILILQVWAWEHIPVTRPIVDRQRAPEQPYVYMYAGFLQQPHLGKVEY